MIRTVLTDAQWAVIAPHCLGRECDPGRTGPDPRRFVEAVLWISRTGCPWRDLPEEFGRRIGEVDVRTAVQNSSTVAAG